MAAYFMGYALYGRCNIDHHPRKMITATLGVYSLKIYRLIGIAIPIINLSRSLDRLRLNCGFLYR